MPISRDPFKEFAKIYDQAFRPRPTRLRFFRLLSKRYRLKNVLDCACGTGDDLIALNSLKLNVIGSDISEAMLNIARQKIKSTKSDMPLYRLDFRRLPKKFKEQFDAVFCLTTSLPQLPNIYQVSKALTSIKSVIKKGGIFVISQGMTDKQYRLKPRFIPISCGSDISRIMVIDYGNKRWQAHIIDLRQHANNLDIKVYDFDYLKLLKKDYQEFLRKAGFKEIKFYSDYTFEKYQKAKSDRLIIIAQK